MKCSRAQRLISDHVDNLLKIRQVRRLESHIQRCVNCRDLLIDMGHIVNNAKEPKTLEPSEDLWPAIKRQVLKKNRKAQMQRKNLFWKFSLYPRGFAFALSTLLAIIVLIPLIYYGLPNMRIPNNDAERIALNHFKIAEQHYQSAIEALGQAIEAQDVKLSPELAAVFIKNLEIIDDSIQICKAAVDQSPENPEANKLLLICYRKKIELLNEIKGINMQTG